jgi:LmbE family N-acetylglucosaminyl deacetylase
MEHSQVLVFSPHFDDETLACGGTLHRLSQAGIHTTVCGLTWSERGYSGDFDLGKKIEIMRLQANEALSILGVSQIIYPDDFWGPDVRPETRWDMHLSPRGLLLERLISIIRRVQPSVVITTHPQDFHTDHRAVATAAREAVYQAPRRGICGSTESGREPVLLYGTVDVESTTPIQFNIVSTLLDVDIEKKCLALSTYEGFVDEHPETARSLTTQAAGRDWVYATARLRGIAAKTEFAEPFELANFAPQIRLESLLRSNSEDLLANLGRPSKSANITDSW